MKRVLLTAAVTALCSAPAMAEDEVTGMAHPARTYHLILGEVDYAREQDRDLVSWDIDAWVGDDSDKLWLKSEGEIFGNETEHAEVQALYSRSIGTYFDAQVGIRHDIELTKTSYLTVGLQGLAPYFLETDAAAFLSDEGDVSFRLEQTVDLLLTQRLILEPHVEANLSLQDVPEQRIGSGLSSIEAGLQLRYEIRREFAPYLDIGYERAFGDTKRFLRADGEEAGSWTLRTGVRLWF